VTVDEIIARWPSATSFAEEVGVPYQTARFWGRRNYVPAEYFPEVIRAAGGRGFTDITCDMLAKIASARRNRVGESEPANTS